MVEPAPADGPGPTPARAEADHVLPLRVYYEDTDAAGMVYHANYLKFTERARTECLRELGFEHRQLVEEARIRFAVRRCEIDFLSPARLDDAIEVHTRLIDARSASMQALQVVRRPKRDGCGELVRMKVWLACVDQTGRPARPPAGLRRALTARIGANPSGRVG
ncbi:MAG: tol-pal system-associated acyl-CoA thioesterase [Kiloniellales bacterium]